MSQILLEVLEANRKYSATFREKGKLALPPARSFAILTCMDARLDLAKAEGDAPVIRNAGGRASDDASRSLIISYKLLGTREFFIIHHTDCGMAFLSDEVMRGLPASSLETAELTPNGFRDVGRGPGSSAGEYIEWLTIRDQKQAVIDDVERFRTHPLIPNPAEPEPKTGSWTFSKTPLNQHKHWLNQHPRKMSCQKQQRSVYRGTKSIPIYGFVYDMHFGKLIEVEGAQAVGKTA